MAASSSNASTALIGLADAANAAMYSMGGTGASSSGFTDQLISGIASAFGGIGNGAATALANASGTGLDGLFKYTNNFSGRAMGGPVGAGSVHQVVENGPELLTVGNRTLLMMGAQGGHVTPTKATGGGIRPIVNNFTVQGNVDRRTQGQISAAAGRAIRRPSTATADLGFAGRVVGSESKNAPMERCC